MLSTILTPSLYPPQDPGFQTLVAQRWAAIRAGPWSDAVVGALIDGEAAVLQPAALRTLDKYANALGTRV